jgi:hypothetical protein
MKIGKHETHPFADTFPMMEGAALDGLAEDISASGLRMPIVLLGELILDGRNRYRACELADVAPRFTQYKGATDRLALVRYIVSVNLARRDLDPGQRALCARRLVSLVRTEIVRKKAQPTLPGVTVATEGQATQLLKSGTPALVAAVDRGDVHLSAAAEISKLPAREQKKILDNLGESAHPQIMSLTLRVTPEDATALRFLVAVAERSGVDEARRGAVVLRRLVPGVFA